jgi:mRNA-degrading endonuclease RelE of RelBE toxin-antitoxin system
MQTDPPVRVIASARFQRDLRLLAKRYRSIQQDVQPVFEQLQSGKLPGVQVPGSGYTIFKVRIKNRNVQKGKAADTD